MAMSANSEWVDQFEEGNAAGGHTSEVEVIPYPSVSPSMIVPLPASTFLSSPTPRRVRKAQRPDQALCKAPCDASSRKMSIAEPWWQSRSQPHRQWAAPCSYSALAPTAYS